MRWLLCSVLLVSFVASAETALALDPLLVEFGWSQPNPVTLPANYVTLLNSRPWDTSQTNNITAFPTTQFAVPDAVEFWNQSCTFGTACGISFANGGQQPDQFGGDYNLDRVLGGPNQLWADGWDGNTQPFSFTTGTWHATAYVSQKGNGNQALYGYQITSVERQITATTQTIRLYGVNAPIPEPFGCLIAILGLLAHFSNRRSGQAAFRRRLTY